jgi:hypothetical protein
VHHLLALGGRRLLDLEVAPDDTKDVERLALVLVETLDLAGEDRVDVDKDAHLVLEELGETRLVLHLDVTESLAERSVLGHGDELRDLLEVDEPVVRAERLGDELGEVGVALEQPAAGRDAVRDVGEVVAALELDAGVS